MNRVSIGWLLLGVLWWVRWWIVGGLGAGAIIFAILHFGG